VVDTVNYHDLRRESLWKGRYGVRWREKCSDREGAKEGLENILESRLS
jgi:hypothetical protein